MALGGFAMTELRYASALFNLMRNLGGAIGIAVVNTWLQDDVRLQTMRIAQALGENARRAPDFVAALAGRISPSGGDADQALKAAQGLFSRTVARIALTAAFEDVFRLMAWIFIAALVMAPFCRPAQQPGAPPPEAH
jgi:DHA2 family multidrug resistance protein